MSSQHLAKSGNRIDPLHLDSGAATGLQCDIVLPRPKLENGRFVVPWEGFRKPGAAEFVRYKVTSEDNSKVPSKEVLEKELPVIPLDKAMVNQPPVDGLTVTWLGHATVLVQMDGISILTDPNFSERCGPLQWFISLPRYTPAPCSVDDLPHIDAVVISHNHYDHLDVSSVTALCKRFDRLHWFVPIGLKGWMMSVDGCNGDVTELSWWDVDDSLVNADGKRFRFAAVPAQHWSKRGLMDDNKTLWGGWCILGPRYKFYFAGDTGYNKDIFKMIGRQYGPFDLAAIPIGAYSPRWFMRYQHLDPDDAWMVHNDVCAFDSIGIHWGTFNTSSEYYLEPRDRIANLQEGVQSEADRLGFFTVNPGETRHVNGWPRGTS